MTAIVVVFLLLAVGGAVLSSVRSQADRQWFAANGEQVQGQITNIRVRRETQWTNNGTGGSTMNTRRRYVPTVQFTTTDGRMVQTETKVSWQTPGREGDVVLVSYDPADPSRARIVSG